MRQLDIPLTERPGRGSFSGKRVANTRGGGYGRPVNPIQIAGLVVPLALIVAALFIVFRFVGAPLFGGKKPPVSSQGSSQSTGQSSSQPGGSSNPVTPPSAIWPATTKIPRFLSDTVWKAT